MTSLQSDMGLEVIGSWRVPQSVNSYTDELDGGVLNVGAGGRCVPGGVTWKGVFLSLLFPSFAVSWLPRIEQRLLCRLISASEQLITDSNSKPE